MSDKKQPLPCDREVFDRGHAIVAIDACMHRAELWVQAVASASGQRVDWHYSSGVANVLYLGDHAAVDAAVTALAADLATPMPRAPGECGSCAGNEHRPGVILRRFGAGAHGLYRAGDPLPPGAVGVVST